jgi:hypothetical protein
MNTNALWLLCVWFWTRTHWRLFVWLGTRLAQHVDYFPDRWYTRRVSILTMMGLTQSQIKDVWTVNYTYANMDAEIRRQQHEAKQTGDQTDA